MQFEVQVIFSQEGTYSTVRAVQLIPRLVRFFRLVLHVIHPTVFTC